MSMPRTHRPRPTGARSWLLRIWTIAVVLGTVTGCALGQPLPATPTIPADAPIFSDPWARPAPAGGNSAIYLTLHNPTERTVRLVAASTQVAQATELHETVKDANGVMRMEPRTEGFAVAPGETLELAPGGKHIMLLNLQQPLEVGRVLSLTVTLEDDRGQVTTELSVPVQEGPGMEMGDMEGQGAMEEMGDMAEQEMEEMGDMGGMEMSAGTMPADALEPQPSETGLFRVTARPQIDPVTVGPIHSWIIHVETQDGTPVTGAQIQVSGGMPAHDHGFPTVPRVTQELGNGDYLLEGVKFSMAGVWVLTLEIAAGELQDTVTFQFELK